MLRRAIFDGGLNLKCHVDLGSGESSEVRDDFLRDLPCICRNANGVE